MFACEFQSTNLLLKMAENKIPNTVEKQKQIIGYHINLREKQKVTTLPGYNVTKN